MKIPKECIALAVTSMVNLDQCSELCSKIQFCILLQMPKHRPNIFKHKVTVLSVSSGGRLKRGNVLLKDLLSSSSRPVQSKQGVIVAQKPFLYGYLIRCYH